MEFQYLAKGIALAGCAIGAGLAVLLIAIVIFLLRRGRRRTYRSSRHRGRAGGNYRGGRRR